MTQMLDRFLILLAASASLTASGQGTIVHNDPPDIPVFGGGTYVYYDLDLNADGVTDFQLRALSGEFMVIPVGQNAVLGTPAPPPNLVGTAAALQSGQPISLNPVSSMAWILRGVAPVTGPYGPIFVNCFSQGCSGDWQGVNSDAYLATQFYIGSETHYGWVHLRVFSNGGYIKEWAYDSVPGQSILAGAVPEPSAWVFGIISLVILLARKGFQRYFN